MKIKYRQAERKWWKYPLTVNLDLYKQVYRDYRNMCTTAKKSYYQHKIQECENDQKALYGMTNQLMFKSKSVILPSHTETQDMAQQFAQFFNDKTDRIRDEIRHNQGPGSSWWANRWLILHRWIPLHLYLKKKCVKSSLIQIQNTAHWIPSQLH